MFKRILKYLRDLFYVGPRVLKEGPAMKVMFFYPGEEGTYMDNAFVKVFENGIVDIRSMDEETMTHIQNCEILWTYEPSASEDRSPNKIRLLKAKPESRPINTEVKNPDEDFLKD